MGISSRMNAPASGHQSQRQPGIGQPGGNSGSGSPAQIAPQMSGHSGGAWHEQPGIGQSGGNSGSGSPAQTAPQMSGHSGTSPGSPP